MWPEDRETHSIMPASPMAHSSELAHRNQTLTFRSCWIAVHLNIVEGACHAACEMHQLAPHLRCLGACQVLCRAYAQSQGIRQPYHGTILLFFLLLSCLLSSVVVLLKLKSSPEALPSAAPLFCAFSSSSGRPLGQKEAAHDPKLT